MVKPKRGQPLHFPSHGRKVRVTVYVPSRLVERLTAEAEEKEVSLSRVVTENLLELEKRRIKHSCQARQQGGRTDG